MSKEIERTREDKCIEVLEYMLEHMLPITKACNNSGIISFQEFYKELKINKFSFIIIIPKRVKSI